MIINKSMLRKYSTIVLVSLPLLGQYGFFTRSFTFADIAIIPAIGIILLWNVVGGMKICDRKYIIFAIWYLFTALIISPFLSDLFSSGTATSILQNSIYFIIVILIAPSFFDCETAFKVYSNVSIVLCVIIFIQLTLNFVTGAVTPWVVNNTMFPAVYTNDDFFSGGYLALIEKSSYRPSSLFSEPALFAQYVTPCLIMNIYKKQKTYKEYIVMVLITASVLLARSANGIIYVLAVWIFAGGCLIVEKIKRKEFNVKKRYIVLIFLVIVFLPKISQVFVEKIFSDDVFSLSQRFAEIFDVKGESSGSMRIVRGWKIFFGMSSVEKIFGIGTGNIVPYLDLHPGIVKMFTSAYNGYMSGLASIFVNSGIIGGFLYLCWWLRYYCSKKTIVKGLQVFLILYMLASNSFNTAQFILTMVMVMSLEKNKEMAEQFK